MCSTISPNVKPFGSVLADNGVFGIMVDDRAQIGNYKDYSISALQNAGIPISVMPSQDMTLDEVSSALKKLSTNNLKFETK